MAASFASVPLLQKKHWPSKPLRSTSALASSPCGFDVPGVGHVDELGDLLLHRLDDARRTVAEQVAAPAGEEVEVAVALGVPDVRAFAAHQAHRIARVVADDVAVGTGRWFLGWSLVRGPLSVAVEKQRRSDSTPWRYLRASSHFWRLTCSSNSLSVSSLGTMRIAVLMWIASVHSFSVVGASSTLFLRFPSSSGGNIATTSLAFVSSVFEITAQSVSNRV